MICIGDILDAETAADLRRILAEAPFEPGRKTAGWAAREAKENLQVDGASPAYSAVAQRVSRALSANETFQSAALPRALTRIIISRSDVGMGYGTHVDNALMGDPPLRTDLAYTLFLSEEEDYDGGDLVIETAEGENAIRLPAGAVVLYPASTLHRVETVTAGSRLVVAGWVQSLVRDPRVREMLFDLDRARRAVFARDGRGDLFNTLTKTYSNLLRLHADA